MELCLLVLQLLKGVKFMPYETIISTFPEEKQYKIENALKTLTKAKLIKQIKTLSSYSIQESGVEFLECAKNCCLNNKNNSL